MFDRPLEGPVGLGVTRPVPVDVPEQPPRAGQPEVVSQLFEHWYHALEHLQRLLGAAFRLRELLQDQQHHLGMGLEAPVS